MSIKQNFKQRLFDVTQRVGLIPTVQALLGGRGVILMFHEIRDDLSHELMTGTTAALLSYTIWWLKENNWAIAES